MTRARGQDSRTAVGRPWRWRAAASSGAAAVRAARVVSPGGAEAVRAAVAGNGAGGIGGGGGGGVAVRGGAGGSGVSECKSNGDCMLYSGAGSGCCGVCQPASDPAPPPVECLLACSSLLTVKTCGCVNNQCVGSKTQL